MNPFGYNLNSRCKNRAKLISNRPVSPTSDAFGYNERSEITGAIVSNIAAEYGYDEIENSPSFTANSLNQYSQFQYDEVRIHELYSDNTDGYLLTSFGNNGTRKVSLE